MSDPLRVALVAEGPTDRIVIEGAMRSILGQRSFVLKQLQPEGSVAFGARDGGWGGVYRWCKQAVQRGHGRLSTDMLLFRNYHLLILHLDADVAEKRYADANIAPERGDGALPCHRGCPPARATTDKLRAVLLSWCCESSAPSQVVMCMPSKSTEAWVIASLFPDDRAMANDIECYPNPEARLRVQRKTIRIGKTQADYQSRSSDLEHAWPRISSRAVCGEALRFQEKLLGKLPPQ